MATKSLTDIYPALRPYTQAELQALTPDQVAELLKAVTAAGDQINTKHIQLETQSTALQQRVTELQAQIKTEFGVDTPEELERLLAEQTAALSGIYTELSTLTLDVQ